VFVYIHVYISCLCSTSRLAELTDVTDSCRQAMSDLLDMEGCHCCCFTVCKIKCHGYDLHFSSDDSRRTEILRLLSVVTALIVWLSLIVGLQFISSGLPK